MPSITLPFRPRLLACAAVLLSLSTPALAQRVVQGDLQQQMSPAEFKAAGLDKLNAAELATLNRWLQGKVEAATTEAVAAVREEAREEGRQEVIVKNRGFFDFGSNEPISGVLQGEFRGFGKGRIYVLDNGQQWEQTDATSISGVRKQSPKVSISPGVMGVWYLKVEGVNTQPKVRRTK
ncbi:putative secreted protein [Stenotrophomonas sp. RIT309]|jgi:hypothetical protein|uniref:hypothetical protein n=1 Tax=Stenotrophomonas TaxID=40323 RepID=UPI0003EA7735|nr:MULTISPECIES: hypothetical protein [Stenotrophomonas]EVT73524.1 hypothetical protein X548_14175 [Stenotrophomonas maltophilia 5BA-I-2]PJL08048.1 hypothetical protein B9Y68_14415 [Stenotrophomonas maltophilia]EZP47599.1 putative secreted protein [Stenotrophomonas sp. RIT309]MCK6230275.1 hypothetical protein [Stenotrophomonas indicatrix]PII12783.1 hypothetical protein CR918_14140 [Stenotrophomonas indicatrix]